MRKLILLVLTISLPMQAFPEQKQSGQAAKEGKTNATTIAWAVFGVVFLVTIGVVAAIAISQNNKDTVIVVQH